MPSTPTQCRSTVRPSVHSLGTTFGNLEDWSASTQRHIQDTALGFLGGRHPGSSLCADFNRRVRLRLRDKKTRIDTRLSILHRLCRDGRGLKDAVPFQILCEGQSFASSGILTTQPWGKEITVHPFWFRLAGKVENRGSHDVWSGSNGDSASRLADPAFDNERNVDNRAA